MDQLLRYITDNSAVIASVARTNKVEAIKKLRTMFDENGNRRMNVADQFAPLPAQLNGGLGLYEAKRFCELAVDMVDAQEYRSGPAWQNRE